MRRYVLVGAAAGLALLALVDALATRAGLVAGILPRSGEPWLWVASRAAGVTAYVALALALTFGLLLSTGTADHWISRARSVELHRWLSSATLALIAGHALLLLGDGFSRFDILDALVPFVASHRPAGVALGIVAAYLALVVQASFELRRSLGVQFWRRLHRMSFGVFALATAHGVFAGSDTALPLMKAVYLMAATPIAALGFCRAISAWRSTRRVRSRVPI